MKKFLSSMIALCAVIGLLCAAGAEAPAPVTADELSAWADGLKVLALENEPDNDPAGEDAAMEDGYLMRYPFAALYADRTEMSGNTRIAAVEITESEESGFRTATVNMTPGMVAALFPNENPEMIGDWQGALLYMTDDAENGLLYGRIRRDGQRICAIEYGQLKPADGGYRMAALTFSFEDSLLSEIRASGTDPALAPLLSEAEKNAFSAELAALGEKVEYGAVKTSRNGMELTEFRQDDLVFSGFDFLNLVPSAMPGLPETVLVDNGDGTWLLTVDAEDYEAVFRTDGDGENAAIVSFTIKGEDLEGPRCIRLGDAFHEDLQRFRFEDNGSDGTTEVLYGTAGTAPYGVVDYGGSEGITLRYGTEAPDGRTVELRLSYTLSRLSEIIIYIQ